MWAEAGPADSSTLFVFSTLLPCSSGIAKSKCSKPQTLEKPCSGALTRFNSISYCSAGRYNVLATGFRTYEHLGQVFTVSLRKPPTDELFLVAHNTRVCKYVQLKMFLYSVQEGRSKENANHCIHAAQTPRPDSNGQIKCHDHYKPKYELFSESEVRAVFTMKAPEMVTYIQEGEKFYLQERDQVAVSRGSVVAGASTAACLLLTAVTFATNTEEHS